MTTVLRLASPGRRPRPFVKWVGGKQAIAARIVERFPSKFARYYKPFVGGGAVFFELSPSDAVLGDGNPWLVDTYEALRDDWRAVARVLDGMVNGVSADDFVYFAPRTTSSAATPTSCALYAGFRVTGVDARRQINLKSGLRDVREVLVTNA